MASAKRPVVMSWGFNALGQDPCNGHGGFCMPRPVGEAVGIRHGAREKVTSEPATGAQAADGAALRSLRLWKRASHTVV